MFKLPEESTKDLIGKPESGMGYQIAVADVNGKRVTAFVFNAELLVMFEELKEINGLAHEELFNKAAMLKSFTLVNVVPAAAGAPPPPGSEPPPGAGDVLAPAPQLLRNTVAHEGFVRFSAYVNDKRVGSDGSLTKDTYATTIGDARFALVGSRLQDGTHCLILHPQSTPTPLYWAPASRIAPALPVPRITNPVVVWKSYSALERLLALYSDRTRSQKNDDKGTIRRLTRSWCGPAASVTLYRPAASAGRTARRYAARHGPRLRLSSGDQHG